VQLDKLDMEWERAEEGGACSFVIEGDRATKKGLAGGSVYASQSFASGRHTFHFVIQKVCYPDAHMFLGVAEVADVHTVGWAFSPPIGSLYIAKKCAEFGADTRIPLMDGDLLGRQEGARVEVTVDMDAHTLAFAIDGQAAVKTEAILPDRVRPYVFMCHEDDAVSLRGGPAPPAAAGPEAS
jgi:hypothetical protein